MVWVIAKLRSTAIVVMASFILSACSLAPKYTRPDTQLPLEWNQHDSAITATTSLSVAPAFFNDDKLRQLIALTMANNKDIALSALNLQKYDAQYGVEKMSSLPGISLQAQQTSAHEPGGIFDTVDTGAVTFHQYDVKLVSASWEIDFWGRLRNLREAAMYDYFSAAAMTRALKINLLEQTVSRYFIYLADREYVDIARHQLAAAVQLSEMAEGAAKAGERNQSQVMDAEKEVRRLRIELQQMQLQAQKDYNALQLIVGSPLPQRLFNDASMESDWHFPVIQEGLPSEVLLKRPDILAAEYQLKAANARIGAARAAFFPTITLSAEGGSSTAALSQLFSGGSAAWSFVPSVTLPIFDGGKNSARLTLAELNKRSEIVNYQKAIQQAFADVSSALAAQSSLNKQSAEMAQFYAASQQQFRMTESTFMAGQISKEALIVQKNGLMQARKQITAMRLNVLLQAVKVYSVLGGDNTL